VARRDVAFDSRRGAWSSSWLCGRKDDGGQVGKCDLRPALTSLTPNRDISDFICPAGFSVLRRTLVGFSLPPLRRWNTSARRVTRRSRNRVSETTSHYPNVFLYRCEGTFGVEVHVTVTPTLQNPMLAYPGLDFFGSDSQCRSHAEASMLRHFYGSSLRCLVSESPIPHGGAEVLQNKSR